MSEQVKSSEKTLFEKIDIGAKYSYLGLSFADGVTTVLDRTIVGTPEATPIYREIMAKFGDGFGFAISLCLEYLLIFTIHQFLPERIKPFIFIIPAYFHCIGFLAHTDILTNILPRGIDTFVWANVIYWNNLAQGMVVHSSELYVAFEKILH